MRVLNNIYDEFVVYKNTLTKEQGLEFEDEKMLSLIIFKNLYPRDFAELQAEKGIVKEAFEEGRRFAEEKCEALETEREEIRDKISSIGQDGLEDIREVKMELWGAFGKNQELIRKIEHNGRSYSFEEYMDDNFNMEQLRRGRIEVCTNNYGWRTLGNTIEEIEANTGGSRGYLDRCKYLKENTPEKKKKMIERERELTKDIDSIRHLCMKDLIGKYEANNVFSKASSVSKNKLLVYLLRNGYMDENYANYMNYFYPNSITRDDMNFILSVRNHEAKPYEYKLSKCEQIVENLLEEEFKQKEVYNFNLLDYLLREKRRSTQKRNMLEQIVVSLEESWEFVDGFIACGEDAERFIPELVAYEAGFWNFIYYNDRIYTEKKKEYFIWIVKYGDLDDLVPFDEQLDSSIAFREYMEKEPVLTWFKGEDCEKLIDLINNIEPHFETVDYESIEPQFLEFIFNNGYYKLNIEMIKNIVRWKGENLLQRLNSAIYTTIRELQYAPLIEKIELNFSEFVHEVVLKQESNTQESLDIVLDILNRNYENTEDCVVLIEKQNVVLEELSQCCLDKIAEDEEHTEQSRKVEAIWSAFLDNRKVVANIDNVLLYWGKYGFTSSLTRFMSFGMDDILNSTDQLENDFIEAFLVCEADREAYTKFISRFSLDEIHISLSKMPKRNIKLLLEQNKLVLTKEKFTELLSCAPDLCVQYLTNNKEILFESIGDYINNEENDGHFELVMETLRRIISSKDWTDEEKALLLENNSLDFILPDVARVITNMKVELKKSIINKAFDILPEEEKYALFLNHISVFSEEEVANKLKQLAPEYKLLGERKPIVELVDNNFNRKLIEHLKGINYITSANHVLKKENKKDILYWQCHVKEQDTESKDM